MKRVVKSSLHSNPRFKEYDQYLDMHIDGVQRSWYEILKPALKAHTGHGITEDDIARADVVIPEHDDSKYMEDEYSAYCDHFYPCEGHPNDEDKFDKAWLLHQHRNPHHWQYWILNRESGEQVALDMPNEYICEMLCDWHSFTLRDPSSTAQNWWENNNMNMTLSNRTRNTVELLIDYMYEPLTK